MAFSPSVTLRIYPDYKPEGEICEKIKKEISSRVGALIGHKIGQTVIASSDSLVISAFLGLEILAIYSNYYYIVLFLISIASVMFGGMLAGIGNSLIVKSKEENYLLFRNISFLTNWMVSWFACCLLCIIQPFMTIWMGDDMLLPIGSVVCVVLYYYTWQFRTPGLFFKDAAGMWQEDFWKPYIGAGINLVVNLFLVNIIGINGVFIPTILCMTFIYFPWETKVIFKKIFGKSSKKFLLSQLSYSLWGVLICAVTYYICSLVNGNIYIIFGVRVLICALIPNIFMIIKYRRTDEYKYLINKLKILLNKFNMFRV